MDGKSRVMNCFEGNWDSMATCRRECGRLSTPSRLLKRDVTANEEAPWHASVYKKTRNTTMPYQQLCGGSLVTPTVVISAAHCFWSDKDQRIASSVDYAVAVGKLYRQWDRQDFGQKSDVSDISVPPHFRGSGTNFQSDISLVTLTTPMILNQHVGLVCVDFDYISEERQLQPGSVGKVAAWNMQPKLKIVEMSYVAVDKCFRELPSNFMSYITSDKICAAAANGTSLCVGDSGGGLVFPLTQGGAQRWYLRGVVSTAPRTDEAASCYPGHTAFTHLLKHDAFVMKLLKP